MRPPRYRDPVRAVARRVQTRSKVRSCPSRLYPAKERSGKCASFESREEKCASSLKCRAAAIDRGSCSLVAFAAPPAPRVVRDASRAWPIARVGRASGNARRRSAVATKRTWSNSAAFESRYGHSSRAFASIVSRRFAPRFGTGLDSPDGAAICRCRCRSVPFAPVRSARIYARATGVSDRISGMP